MRPPPSPHDPTIAQQFGMFFLVLSSFCGASGAGVAIGWLLWKKAGFPGWVLAVTTALGMGAAVVQVNRYYRRLQRNG